MGLWILILWAFLSSFSSFFFLFFLHYRIAQCVVFFFGPWVVINFESQHITLTQIICKPWEIVCYLHSYSLITSSQPHLVVVQGHAWNFLSVFTFLGFINWFSLNWIDFFIFIGINWIKFFVSIMMFWKIL